MQVGICFLCSIRILDHRTNSPYNEFSYENLDRLTGITYHDSDSEAFGMDDLGNRDGNQTLRDAGTVNFLVDDDTNRYTSIGGNAITHDDAGNLTRDRQDYRYEYDYENRIARIYKLSGQSQITVATFDYDALGHRVRKIDAVAGQTTLYYNDPEWRVLAEYDGSGTLQRTFVWGNYIDEALRMRAGGNDYYYLHDHLYSPAVLINSSGTVVERYEYDAYGTVHFMDPSFGNRTATQYGVTTLFTGRTLDTLDSANLKIMYYRHRYTDPFTGRFLQQDPMGLLEDFEKDIDPFIQYKGNLNLFGYCKNAPNENYDPYGTCECSFSSKLTVNHDIPIVRKIRFAGQADVTKWKVNAEMIKCKGKSSCYKVELTKCEGHVEWWYYEFLRGIVKDDFGNDPKEHELIHVQKVRMWWNRMVEEIQDLELKECYPKYVARSCRDAINKYGKAYYQVMDAGNRMFDCLAYGITNDDARVCQQAAESSEKASRLIREAYILKRDCIYKKSISSPR